MQEDANHFFKEAFKSKGMVILFKLIVGTFAVILIVVLFKIVFGQYVNVWGLEINKSDKKLDTIYSSAPSKHDTVLIEKTDTPKTITQKSILPNIQKPKKNNDTSSYKQQTKKDTVPVVQKNVNNATNYGSIGDNNTNYFGNIKQHPEERLLLRIDSALGSNKDQAISVEAITSGAGSPDFATELGNKMKQRGYTKIILGVGQMSPIPRKGVTLTRLRNQVTLLVNID
jgi:hypothetical protein